MAKGNREPIGYLCIVLHAHLPFVRHPEADRYFEEDWLHEAVTETYIPLVRMMERLAEGGTRFRLTLSISPTLAAMLRDPLLQERSLAHIDRMIEISDVERIRTCLVPELHALACRYGAVFREARRFYDETLGRDLIAALRRMQDAGALEIVTTGATHGYLPLMRDRKAAWRGQIHLAARDYESCFGRRPKGIWLPECGYVRGIEEVLAEANLSFFFLETHGILDGSPIPRHGVHAPVASDRGIAAFGRDPLASRSVWSATEGYPGDPVYREFHRDIGWDLDYDAVLAYLHGDGSRCNLGIKYHRVTGGGGEKGIYDFHAAEKRAGEHALAFLRDREAAASAFHERFGKKAMIVCPYDAELFGHWWFEGPLWLERLIREIAKGESVITMVTPTEYLERCGVGERSTPAPSSWGNGGYSETWLNEANDWIYPHLHAAADRMSRAANRHGGEGRGPLRSRALRQAARELLLAQSSDWAFIMKSGTLVDYATQRTHEHLGNFERLCDAIDSDTFEEDWLSFLEGRHNILPDLDVSVYSDVE